MKGIGIFILSLISLNAIAQNAVLRSGPVIGYVDSTRAYIWIDPEPGTTKFRVTWFEKGSKKTSDSLEITRNQKDTLPVTFKIKNLNPATSYSIRITVDDKPVTHGYAPGFTTASAGNNKPEQFSFLFGSCLYLNDPGETKQYGNDPGILNEMSLKQSDFMIWGGDNFYLRNNEWKSREGIVSRYNKTRRFLFIQPLMGSRANFAICDDHDYGPDDCTGTYDLASFSRETFKQYWPTKSYSDNHGLYQKFTWNDCEFFLMDNRSFRVHPKAPGVIDESLNRDKRFFGKQQLQWLIQGLKESKATFKFIVSGGQMLNPLAEKECLRYYNYEYNKLVRAILDNKIEGVIFLSGDRHYSELIATQPQGGYTLFDFTCSSLTSEVRSIEKTKEIDNPYRIPNTLFMGNNFSRIIVNGKNGDRKVKLEVFDSKGKEVWDFSILESDLKFLKKKK